MVLAADNNAAERALRGVVDGDQLLALGLEIDPERNTVEGLAVSWFDVSDLETPVLFDRLVFRDNGWSWSEALSDHHAITYHRDVLSFPRYRRSDQQGHETSLAVVDVIPGQPLAHLGMCLTTTSDRPALTIGYAVAS